MLQNLWSAFQIRALIVFLIIHSGLGLGIFVLARTTAVTGWDKTATLLLSCILCLYGGFVLAVSFALWSLIPWLRRARQARNWMERLVAHLPYFLEQLPQIVAAIQALIIAIREGASAVKNPRAPSTKRPQTPKDDRKA